MVMVAEDDQSFEGLIEHLCDAFQLGETLSELIGDFYGWIQNYRETEDTFTNDLQVLARKIIVWKPSFHLKAKDQLKAQYAHKLWDSLLCGHGPQCVTIFPRGRNIYKAPGMAGYHVWKACKAEQILCHFHRHQHQNKSHQRFR